MVYFATLVVDKQSCRFDSEMGGIFIKEKKRQMMGGWTLDTESIDIIEIKK